MNYIVENTGDIEQSYHVIITKPIVNKSNDAQIDELKLINDALLWKTVIE